MIKDEFKAITWILLSAILYAASSPASKLLLEHISPTMLSAFLYLGAAIGMVLVNALNPKRNVYQKCDRIGREELPYIMGIIFVDVIGSVLSMVGLSKISAADTALLNNFNTVTTALIALFIFKERISKRLWTSIILVTISSIILSFDDITNFSFSLGAVLVLLSCICWGFDNNFTRVLSNKNNADIVMIKGFGTGIASLIIAFMFDNRINGVFYVLLALVLGFLSYGLSILFYIKAQRRLGAAKTSTYYAITPFLGVLFSLIIFSQMPNISLIIALIIMMFAAYFAYTDKV